MHKRINRYRIHWLLGCWLVVNCSAGTAPGQPMAQTDATALQPPTPQPPQGLPPGQDPPPTRPNQRPPNSTTRPSPRPVPRNRPAPTGLSLLNLASIPNMLGDTSGGGCGSLTLQGIVVGSIEHPTFACGRLNIAENNRAIVTDRVYANYRHFHNGSFLDAFTQTPFQSAAQSPFHIDRLTLGIEKRLGCAASLEVRVPINRQMSSDLRFSKFTNMVANLPLDDYDTVLGDVAVLFKRRLWQSRNFYFSGGVAANLPTAPDVTGHLTINDTNFQVIDIFTGMPVGAPIDVQMELMARVRNETVNITPFLAYAWTPYPAWFSQGFVQFDIPVNQFGLSIHERLAVNGVQLPDVSHADRQSQQPLLRINWGLGRWLWRRDPCEAFIHSLAVMCELHYTTTLHDAELSGPFVVAPDLGTGPTVTTVGNLGNQIDVVNVAFGIPVGICAWNFSNGVVFPLRNGDDRGFDVEYNLHVERRF